MKKIFFSIMAVAALAACTKSEVQYETPDEIVFAPAEKNITKAAHGGIFEDAAYPTDQRLGVFANYGLVDPGTTVRYLGDQANIGLFDTPFLNDAVFSYKTVDGVSAWGGGYSWPITGSLVFAGYTLPAEGTVGTSRSYDFSTDKLRIEGYTQSTNTAETFDLGWFDGTMTSYNYRNQKKTVDVSISHALSWIEIKVKGEGTTIDATNPWTITSITMNNVANTGDVVCTDAGAGNATWSNRGTANQSITIFTGKQPLTGDATVCETNAAGTLVIPQFPTALDAANPVGTLTIKFTYKSPASTEDDIIWMPEQSATVSLDCGRDGWRSGLKYTYTLTFKASEILISPEYGYWSEESTPPVTVE